MRLTLFLCFLFKALCGYSQDILEEHHQLLLVTAEDWEKHHGTLKQYEREDHDSPWVLVEASIPVVLGHTGLAWGIGLHPTSDYPCKIEGDGKSPAGIFTLGCAFGFAPMTDLRIDYLPLDEGTEAVDDLLSAYYNTIVNVKEVSVDWSSSEKMRQEPLYAWGLVVNHNFPHPTPGAGSAIFMHIWPEDRSGTSGCTAMSQDDLLRILLWLEKSKNPVLVQLPICEYHALQDAWCLPH